MTSGLQETIQRNQREIRDRLVQCLAAVEAARGCHRPPAWLLPYCESLTTSFQRSVRGDAWPLAACVLRAVRARKADRISFEGMRRALEILEDWGWKQAIDASTFSSLFPNLALVTHAVDEARSHLADEEVEQRDRSRPFLAALRAKLREILRGTDRGWGSIG